MRIRAREAADQESVERFLGERYSARVARTFYQRRGFKLAELHAGAVDESRATLKPEIPTTGEYGIPLRDEPILEKELDE